MKETLKLNIQFRKSGQLHVDLMKNSRNIYIAAIFEWFRNWRINILHIPSGCCKTLRSNDVVTML